MIINFLGDSITEGAGAGSLEGRYTTCVCGHFGAQENNFGVSGTRIAKQTRRTLNPDDDVFMRRAVLMDKNADFTFVFGGTNDFGHGDAELGALGDDTDDTFYGAFDRLTAYLVGSFDKNKLCFILPLQRSDADNAYGDGSKEKPGALLVDYIRAEVEILQKYGVEYLCLDETFPKSEMDPGSKLTGDGLHPSPFGHKLLGDCLISYLKEKGF